MSWIDDKPEDTLRCAINEAVKELQRPCAVSYEYDPTPTEKDRMQTAVHILTKALNEAN